MHNNQIRNDVIFKKKEYFYYSYIRYISANIENVMINWEKYILNKEEYPNKKEEKEK